MKYNICFYRCLKWVDAAECHYLLRLSSNLSSCVYYRICSLHFEDKMYAKNVKGYTTMRRLIKNSYPTLNLPRKESRGGRFFYSLSISFFLHVMYII